MSELDIFELIIVAVVGSGGLAFFIKYGSRLAVLESKMRDQEDAMKQLVLVNNTISVLDRRVAQVEQTLIDMRSSISKLNQMDLVADRLDHLVKFTDNVIPRPELELRLQAQEARITALQRDVEKIKSDE